MVGGVKALYVVLLALVLGAGCGSSKEKLAAPRLCLPSSTDLSRLSKPSQGFLSHTGAISIGQHAGFVHGRRESIVVWTFPHIGTEWYLFRLRRMFSYSTRRTAIITGYNN